MPSFSSVNELKELMFFQGYIEGAMLGTACLYKESPLNFTDGSTVEQRKGTPTLPTIKMQAEELRVEAHVGHINRWTSERIFQNQISQQMGDLTAEQNSLNSGYMLQINQDENCKTYFRETYFYNTFNEIKIDVASNFLNFNWRHVKKSRQQKLDSSVFSPF